MIHRRCKHRIHRKQRTTTNIHRLQEDPYYLACQDWVLHRANCNPFRQGTTQAIRYDQGHRHARRNSP